MRTVVHPADPRQFEADNTDCQKMSICARMPGMELTMPYEFFTTPTLAALSTLPFRVKPFCCV